MNSVKPNLVLDIIRENGTVKAKDKPETSSVKVTEEIWKYLEETDPVLLREHSEGTKYLKMSRKKSRRTVKPKKYLTIDFVTGKINKAK